MNLSLLDPFAIAKEYPETLSHTFAPGHTVTLEFSPRGDYLACGLADGRIAVWLAETESVVAELACHSRPIQSIAWLECGRYLVSALRDWQVAYWDLAHVEAPAAVCRLEAPVWGARMRPGGARTVCYALYGAGPGVLEFDARGGHERRRFLTRPRDGPVGTRADATLVLAWVDADHILAGTSQGWLNLVAYPLLETVYSLKAANLAVKHILVVHRTGHVLVAVNAADSVIRQYHVALGTAEPLVPTLRFQDVVNRLQWNSLMYSPNGDYVVASTHSSAAHHVYLWESGAGGLAKILEGPKEELVDVAWQGGRCAIAACGIDSGSVYIWLVVIPHKWSALAPDFVEIEENIEYEEHEDEFDGGAEEEEGREEQVPVDVVTREDTNVRGGALGGGFAIPVSYLPLRGV